LIEYDIESNTSLVFCAPITGRTHQLRNHLKLCGHTIVNDDYQDLKKIKSENHWETYFDEKQVFLGIDPIKENPDPDPCGMSICLHAIKYESADWNLETRELPSWTKGFNCTRIDEVEENLKKEMKRIE
jgi:hypothetical protein